MTSRFIRRASGDAWSLCRSAAALYWELLKAMVPVMILVRIGVEFGVIDTIATGFAPLMEVVGLPAATGLVWAASILVNTYAGAAVFIAIFPSLDLNVAQVTVLLSMLLIAHALPVEQAISRRAGISFLFSSALRFGGALLYGIILNALYVWGDWLQQPAEIVWISTTSAIDAPWREWALSSLTSLFWLFWLILALVVVLKLLDVLTVTAWLQRALTPLLRLMGISEQAASLTMVGALLGLSFGGGLIIKEARAGHIAPRDIVLSLSFMALCHSLIEDTLFMLALGGDISGLLVGRFLFAVAVTAVLGRAVHAMGDAPFNRFLFRRA